MLQVRWELIRPVIHGMAPALVLADELAKWPAGNVEAMIAANRNQRGARFRKIRGFSILGTRAASRHTSFRARCCYLVRLRLSPGTRGGPFSDNPV